MCPSNHGGQSPQVMPVKGAANFNCHGGSASILLDKFMAFLGNGEAPPAVLMMVAVDANSGAVVPTRVYPGSTRYGTRFFVDRAVAIGDHGRRPRRGDSEHPNLHALQDRASVFV